MIRLLKWCYEKGCVWVLDTQKKKTHSTFCVERSCCVFEEFVFVKGDGEGIVDPDGEIEAETI